MLPSCGILGSIYLVQVRDELREDADGLFDLLVMGGWLLFDLPVVGCWLVFDLPVVGGWLAEVDDEGTDAGAAVLLRGGCHPVLLVRLMAASSRS